MTCWEQEVDICFPSMTEAIQSAAEAQHRESGRGLRVPNHFLFKNIIALIDFLPDCHVTLGGAAAALAPLIGQLALWGWGHTCGVSGEGLGRGSNGSGWGLCG